MPVQNAANEARRRPATPAHEIPPRGRPAEPVADRRGTAAAFARACAHLRAGSAVFTDSEMRAAVAEVDRLAAERGEAWAALMRHRAEIAQLMTESAALRRRLADVPGEVGRLEAEAEQATKRAVVAEDAAAALTDRLQQERQEWLDQAAELADAAEDCRRELEDQVARAELAEGERDEAVERAVAAELAVAELAGGVR